MRKVIVPIMITTVFLVLSSVAFGVTKDSTTVAGVDSIIPTSYMQSGVYGLCLSHVSDGYAGDFCSAKSPAKCISLACSCEAGFTPMDTGKANYKTTGLVTPVVLLTGSDGSWKPCTYTGVGCLPFSTITCYKE